MEISKDNIRVRSATLEDAAILNRWWNDGSVMEHAGFPNGLGQSLEETQANVLRNNPSSERLILEIDGERVGEASYKIEDNAAYPGWKICEASYQNQGYGTKIILMLFDWLFSVKGPTVEKIVWDTMIENERARHVYENKIKARKTEIIEKAFVDQLGRDRTAVVYELSKDEFHRLHG